MQSFKFNGARVSIGNVTNSGLCEAIYTGPMTAKAFETLRSEKLQATTQCSAYVVRLDRVLVAMGIDEPLEKYSYAPNTPPGAMIVRLDQYEFWQAYALQAAELGVVRTVWLESNARLAYEWALRRCHLCTAKLQH